MVFSQYKAILTFYIRKSLIKTLHLHWLAKYSIILDPPMNYILFLSDEGPMLETLDYTIRIGSTPTFLYFNLYLYSAYAGHYVYMNYTVYTT